MEKIIAQEQTQGNWALILGGSRGFGLATARKLASHGYNLFLVHRDRKSDLPEIEAAFDNIRSHKVHLEAFNRDALNPERRMEILERIREVLGGNQKISVLVHSIAKGHVKPMAGSESLLSGEDFMLTLHAMAVSWYEWTQALLQTGLCGTDTRVMAFTSEGATRPLAHYGAVAAAKAALEAIGRNMAVELAPQGIKANCIQAGVAETTSFAMIPNSEKIKAYALKRNPSGRLTRPEDVADVVYLLTRAEAGWITGTVIKADGGESLR